MSKEQRDPQNPYASPMGQAGPPPEQLGPGQCPRCGSGHYKTPSFTWWGGVVGQRIIDHVVCEHCRMGFSSKTGRSNGAGIAIYIATVSMLVILSILAVFVFFG